MKIAGCQIDVVLADLDGNVDRMIARLRETAAGGARLTIFPECAATGYCFETLEECYRVAQPVPGPITERLTAACRELHTYCVFGMVERDGDRVFNVAVLVGPNGVEYCYRKIHLPWLGLDKHATHGDRPFGLAEIEGVRIGINICYDAGFPESSRVLSLLGADLIILPTNWPPGAETVACGGVGTRAMENAVYYAAINRVGVERGFKFIGHSSIHDPTGKPLATSSGTEETILWAEIDPEKARNKHIVRTPGKHEIDRFADRRPEFYRLLTEPHQLPTPRDRHPETT